MNNHATCFKIQIFKKVNGFIFSAALQAIGGSLTFKRLAVDDSAMYQCVAYNELNNIYQSAYMGVRGIVR